MHRFAFGGGVEADIFCPDARPQMASIHLGAFAALPPCAGKPVTETVLPFSGARDVVQVLKRFAGAQQISLRHAKVIVAGRLGVGFKDGFSLLEALAERLGSELAASRAAIDAGFAPWNRQVGQTGCQVSPALYLTFGAGASGAIVSDAQHKLLRLGLNANAYTDPHLQVITASYATADDVIFAISHSGSPRIVVDNAQLAKNNGAHIISLTNIGRSPLSQLADICLYTASHETKYRILAVSSRIAELTVIDCIYTYIAIRSQNSKDLKVEKGMEWLKY